MAETEMTVSELRDSIHQAHLKLCETRGYLELPEGCTVEQIMGVVTEALDILEAAMWPDKEKTSA